MGVGPPGGSAVPPSARSPAAPAPPGPGGVPPGAAQAATPRAASASSAHRTDPGDDIAARIARQNDTDTRGLHPGLRFKPLGLRADETDMETLLGSGVLVMIAADAVVGVRLLWLAKRTRELPELAMGAACLLMGVIGYPLSIAARSGAAWGGLEPASILTAGFVAQNLACLAMAVATQRVFRREARWAAGFVGVAAAAFVASSTLGAGRDGGALYWLGFATRGACFVWTALEAGRYARLLGRRVRLGLADPVVHDRIRLWALATAAIGLGFGVFMTGRLTSLGTQSPVVLATTSLIGVVAGVAMWLAFVPPAAYLRRVAARAA